MFRCIYRVNARLQNSNISALAGEHNVHKTTRVYYVMNPHSVIMNLAVLLFIIGIFHVSAALIRRYETVYDAGTRSITDDRLRLIRLY